VAQSQLPEIHRSLDLVVIPSLWHENATIVLLESRALGTPVLVSNVEGMAPLIEPGRNGFTFPMGDAQALAERLGWSAAHRHAVGEMANRCEPVETTDGHAARMEIAYLRLLA
jgi:glycosyltransferase involved in cell wall biosynthesis